MQTVTVVSGSKLRVRIGPQMIGDLSVPGEYRIADAATVSKLPCPTNKQDAKATAKAALIAGESDLIRVLEDVVVPLYEWAVAAYQAQQASQPIPSPGEFFNPANEPAIVIGKFEQRAAYRAILAGEPAPQE